MPVLDHIAPLRPRIAELGKDNANLRMLLERTSADADLIDTLAQEKESSNS